jgi:glycosyltransferase involved in cell wall biosynthesis
MRILVICRVPLGCNTDVLKLCEYGSLKHNITYMSFSATTNDNVERRSLSVPNVTPISVSVHGSVVNRFIRLLYSCYHETRRHYDVIYICYFPGCSLLSLVHSRRKMILDIRSGCVSSSWLLRMFCDALISFEGGCFNHVHIISEGLRARLRLPHLSSAIVPLGADPLVIPSRAFDCVHLLYVGTLCSVRRIEDTVIGFARLSADTKKSVNLQYTIVGDGPPGELERLANVAKHLGVSSTVHFVGYVPHEELSPYFERCNVGVSYVPITSYFDHQPPTKTFEYLHAGMPVIATATSENRKIVNCNNGVLIADTADAFCEGVGLFLKERGRYRSDAIRESVAAYSWKAITRRKLSLLEDVYAELNFLPN